MISIIAQERLLGAALGALFTGTVVFEQRRSIYASISDRSPDSVNKYLVREPPLIFRKGLGSEIAHAWNRAVDRSLGPVIASLSSRGW